MVQGLGLQSLAIKAAPARPRKGKTALKAVGHSAVFAASSCIVASAKPQNHKLLRTDEDTAV